jgi:hypothetical protein
MLRDLSSYKHYAEKARSLVRKDAAEQITAVVQAIYEQTLNKNK